MKRLTIWNLLLIACLSLPFNAQAGDFDWFQEFNMHVEVDQTWYKATLGTRFLLFDSEVEAIVGAVDKAADAYMVLRLSEISQRSVDDVMEVYKVKHSRGWGVVAKHLGIHPGSKEFHAFKRGHDLFSKGRRQAKAPCKKLSPCKEDGTGKWERYPQA